MISGHFRIGVKQGGVLVYKSILIPEGKEVSGLYLVTEQSIRAASLSLLWFLSPWCHIERRFTPERVCHFKLTFSELS